MSVVDLAKARAHATSLRIGSSEHELSADWIEELADEVESLQRALVQERQQYAALSAQMSATQDENEQLHAGLGELYERIGAMLREARHIIDHHPDPAASAAAMRIAREDKS